MHTNALRVPGTAALEPDIQKICHLLEDRLARPDGRFLQDDWQRLVLVSRLHSSALARVDPEERREFSRAAKLGSGWWGECGNGNAKPKDSGLERTLTRCLLASAELPEAAAEAKRRLRGPGAFALRHKRLAAFAYVGRDACQVLAAVRGLLGLAFDGVGDCEDEALSVVAAALLLTRQEDWQLTMAAADSEQERLALQNELTLRHGTLWPCGLNVRLNQTLACLKELVSELGWRPNGGDRSHLQPDDRSMTARRLGLVDLSFEDFQRLAFDSDESGLYRCDESVKELSRLAQQLRSRGEAFRQVDFAACHRLHAMAAELAEKPLTAERLRYRRAVREHSGWWGGAEGDGAFDYCDEVSPPPGAFFKDSIANLDRLATTLTKKLEDAGANAEATNVEGDYARLQMPGVFVLRHRYRSCWHYVSRPCQDALTELRRLLHSSLDGFASDGCPGGEDDLGDARGDACVVSALLLLSRADEWQFELHPETDRLGAEQLYNRLVLQLNTLWPQGANLALLIGWQTLPALQDSMVESLHSE